MSSRPEQAQVNLKNFDQSKMHELFNKYSSTKKGGSETNKERTKRRKSRSMTPEIAETNTSSETRESKPEPKIKKANLYNRIIKRIPLLNR